MSDDQKEYKKSVILPETTVINYDFERMLKSFKKQMERDGIIEEVKRRKYYIKKSELKRLAKKSKRRK